MILILWQTSLMDLFAFSLFVGIAMSLGVPMRRQTRITFGLVHLAIIATFLCLGLTAAVATVVIGLVIAETLRHLLTRDQNYPQPTFWDMVIPFLVNNGLPILGLIAGATVFGWMGGSLSLSSVSLADVSPIVGLILTYFFINQLGQILYLMLADPQTLSYLKQKALGILAHELMPQPIAVLISLVYRSLPTWALWTTILSLLAAGFIINRLDNARRRLEQQLSEASALNQISHQMTASLNPAIVFDSIVEAMVSLTSCQRAGIFVLGKTDEAISLIKGLGLSDEFIEQAQNMAVDTIRAMVVRHQKPVVVEDIEKDARFASVRKVMRNEGIRAFADLPMVSRGRIIGVLTAYFDRPHRLEQNELQLLSTFANHAAIAIDNADRYAHSSAALAERVAQLSAKNKQLASLLEVGNALQADMGLGDILDQIVKSVVNSMGFRAAILSMLQEGHELMLQHVAAAGIDYDAFRRLKESPTLLTRFQALMKPRFQIEQAYFVPVTESQGHTALREEIGLADSILFVPLFDRQDKLVGILSVDIPDGGPIPSQETIEALTIFANQASVAIETATLFSTIQQRVAELSILHRVGLELASSFDLTHVLGVIVESALNLITADDIHIFLYDEQTDQISYGTSLWADGRTDTPYRTPRPNGLTYTVARTGEPLVVNDPASHPLFSDTDYLVAIAGFPLKHRDEVIGVLNVAFALPHTFSEEELRLLNLLGGQAAIAISNARLFRQVQEGRDQLQAIVDSTQDGIIVFDNQGRVLVVNSMIEELMGLSHRQLIGCTPDDLTEQFGPAVLTPIGHTPDSLLQAIANLARQPETVIKDEFEAKHPTRRIFERILTPVRGQQNTAPGYVMVLHDVTESHEVAGMRESLTQMIVHDLRAPLSSIIASVSVLDEMEFGDPDVVTLSSIISNSSQRMLNLVNSLLDIAALEAGRLPLQRSSCQVSTLVENAIKRVQPVAHSDQIKIESRIDANTPPVYIDTELIERVLINLLDNALKFSPTGSVVKLEVSPKVQKAERRMVQFAVHDEGPGTSPDEREHIFEKFTQVKGRQGRRRGSGLGLTFCKLAIEAHSGSIWVEDSPAGGSCFAFTLPAAD